MTLLKDTRGLVLDMRQNGGGSQAGNAIIARLVTQKVTRYAQREKLSDFTLSQRPEIWQDATWTPGDEFAQWRDRTVEPSDRRLHYAKPVVELIATRCFSACDTFTAGLQVNHLATIVGEPSGGGQGRRWTSRCRSPG